MKITFDENVKHEILDLFDKSVDEEEYIVEKSNPKQRVLTFDGQEIKIDEFGGIKSGSEVFIKKDLVSLMKLSKICGKKLGHE
ncbi:MAG: hypothetical protein COX07_08405 [Bacteroidetes bacterium CG23_combo_of_CG06-09_8_20_14_all_32_9]|nr:MAG: hypothetical protein COX07_08405 [Bacteroidetes bacterium CG23_combo_of_CG06-09_8_20_14_all_32_9]